MTRSVMAFLILIMKWPLSVNAQGITNCLYIVNLHLMNFMVRSPFHRALELNSVPSTREYQIKIPQFNKRMNMCTPFMNNNSLMNI